uniref:Uncharacterized protein n=1 Tax=Chlorocebus sabaeus TaxID=60711 RepID=A0A0D9SD27_CHLSB
QVQHGSIVLSLENDLTLTLRTK